MDSLLLFVFAVVSIFAHDEPDPVMYWDFNPKFIKGQILVAQKGPNLKVPDDFKSSKINGVPAVVSMGTSPTLVANADAAKRVLSKLPQEQLTVSSWVSVDQSKNYGGIVCFLQDNGDNESGWVLGYNQESFYVGLASAENQRMTYLVGKTKYELGKMYHVCATYDGKELALYVNGRRDAISKDQSGNVRYPDKAVLAVGGYVDDNENFPHAGTLRSVLIYDEVATAKGILQQFESERMLAEAPARIIARPILGFEAKPFLQMAATDSMTVSWATNTPTNGQLFWGETDECKNSMPISQNSKVHQVRIKGLQSDTQYFYRTESAVASGAESNEDETEALISDVSTFETAPKTDSPIVFALISDTQGNPEVANKMAKFAWSQRPDFLVIPGDLTDTGTVLEHWTEQFFPSMDVLISRVPMYPVLGNHERNAHYYYDFMALPDPEYYYTFDYGPAQFFMIDSNKKCDAGSEQYVWLEKQLKASQASWKIVVHHHPVYSSDENDYGNLWKQNKSSQGDMNVRAMSKLYDQFGVDVVFNGHIHSYERTWPVKDGKVVDRGGVQYFITGGGGGSLETAGPSRPAFQNTVKRGHHYAMVRINGDVFEFQAYDLEGVLFDTLRFDRRK